ncbi:MAG: hypothetical protein AB7L65_05570 [Hyphomonadaceae bacterium]
MSADKAPSGNDDFAWRRFDPEAYVAHYYADPHPDDDEAVRMTARALAALAPGADVLDVGTGPNLFPLMAALPRASTVTAWEFSSANTDWLRRELARKTLRAPWPHFWNVVREGYGGEMLADDPLPALKAKARIVEGSIFDLPARRWDGATMFFCAESITERQEEFERACHAFARAVKPGGVLAAAFLAKSEGYVVAETAFPAVSISADTLAAAFAGAARDVAVTAVGLVEEEIRSGYSGMLFLRARAA